MTLDRNHRLFARLFLVAALVLVIPVVIMARAGLAEFATGLVPEMDKKAETVGRDLADSIERAVGYGIPLDRLEGMDEFFAPVLTANREIRYLAVTDRPGRILFVNGVTATVLAPALAGADYAAGTGARKSVLDGFVNLSHPLVLHGEAVGHVHVGLDQGYVRQRLAEIAIDIGVVCVVALVVALEILMFVVSTNITGPILGVDAVMDRIRRGDYSRTCAITSNDEVGRFVHSFNGAIRHTDAMYRRLLAYIDEVKSAHFDKTVVERVSDIEARIRYLFRFAQSGQPETTTLHRAADIRLPLFLFVFAEELSRPFMPLYIRELHPAGSAMGREIAIALPIALFMLVIAAVSPGAALLSARLGSRRVFQMGLWPATAGFCLSAMATSIYDLTLWRCLTAVGYAMITMACQGFIAQTTPDQRRSQGLGVYVGGVLMASICGTGIGGVLAERTGFRTTFVVAAALCIASAMLIHRLMDTPQAADAARSPRKRELLGLLRNWRFSALVLFAAIPSKIALTGFFFFLVPLTLMESPDTDLGDVARMMMMYPAAVVVLSPLAARLADKMGWNAGLVAVGGLIGGIGLLLPGWLANPALLGPAITLLGISHGLSASPQLAMIPDVCWTECRNMGRTNVLAFLRLAERIGSFAGPLLAAALVPAFGYLGATMALGWVVLGLGAVFALLSFAYGAGPHIEPEADE